MKKRVLALTMALAMTAGLLGGCGGGSAEVTKAPEASAPAASAPAASAPAQSNSGSAAAFKLGGIGPMTGGAAIYGNAAMWGAEIAVDEINALGGDIQFEFNPQDDQHVADTSVNAYHALQDWGVQLIVGTVTTGPCLAVAPEAYADRVFMLTPSASSTDVIDGKDNVYQVCFTDPNQGIASADYMAEHYPDAKVAIIYKNDDAYSQGIRDTFKSEADAKGLSVVYEGTFTEDTQTDFSVQVSAARAAEADMVFLPIYYTPASVILTQANAIGYAPTFFGVDGMDGILTVEKFDTSLAEGVMLLTPFSADAQDDLTVNFVKEYQARHNEIPNQFAADGYDAVYILYKALEAAKCTPDMSAADICEALIGVMPTISVDGLTGQGMTWKDTGEVSKAPMAVVIKDGAYVLPD